jgi:DNA-binding response OmpR family regulator
MPRAKRKPNTKKLQGKRILVVEDQPLVSELLTDLLRLYDHPSQASSGKEALEQIKHNAPDVILDLSPRHARFRGRKACASEMKKTSRIPILAMSVNPMNKRKCLEMGCNDFIHKPFSVSTLLIRLSALIPSRSPTQNVLSW